MSGVRETMVLDVLKDNLSGRFLLEITAAR
jgi:hypothetical protein